MLSRTACTNTATISPVKRIPTKPIKMATNGWAWWGKLAVTQDLNVDIPINVPAGKQNLDVALWWPESAPQAHNDIDVVLIDPNGVERATATSVESIFERTGVQGSLTAGVWTVRVSGASVPAGPQTVYWATTIRN